MSTVLIVDDSATDRKLAGGLLERSGEFQVIYAADGQDALAQLELHLPDMILTDLNMPGIDGLELTKSIRANYPFLPVILMTAKGSEDVAVQALQFGAANYVPKRVLAKELLDIMRQVSSLAKEDRGQARLMRRMLKQEVEFAVENDAELISSLVKFLQQGASSRGICDATGRIRVGVALQEALTNACYHGNLEVSSTLREIDHRKFYELCQERSASSPYCDRRIYITAKFTTDAAEYVIRDQGPGFDPTTLPDPTDPENLDRPCGRGLLLMQTFMDEVRFNKVGNEVSLVKRRVPQSAPQNGAA